MMVSGQCVGRQITPWWLATLLCPLLAKCSWRAGWRGPLLNKPSSFPKMYVFKGTFKQNITFFSNKSLWPFSQPISLPNYVLVIAEAYLKCPRVGTFPVGSSYICRSLLFMKCKHSLIAIAMSSAALSAKCFPRTSGRDQSSEVAGFSAWPAGDRKGGQVPPLKKGTSESQQHYLRTWGLRH